MSTRERREVGRMTVELTPHAGQSRESIEADFTRSFLFSAALVEGGVESYHSRFWRRRPVKVMVSKEVGPPAWRMPRVHGTVQRRPIFVAVCAGWRMTAYKVCLLVDLADRSASSAGGRA